jgi:hypothetical protein
MCGCPPPAGRAEGVSVTSVVEAAKKLAALVLVDELPRSAAGKVLRHEPRRKYGQALSGGSCSVLLLPGDKATADD